MILLVDDINYLIEEKRNLGYRKVMSVSIFRGKHRKTHIILTIVFSFVSGIFAAQIYSHFLSKTEIKTENQILNNEDYVSDAEKEMVSNKLQEYLSDYSLNWMSKGAIPVNETGEEVKYWFVELLKQDCPENCNTGLDEKNIFTFIITEKYVKQLPLMTQMYDCNYSVEDFNDNIYAESIYSTVYIYQACEGISPASLLFDIFEGQEITFKTKGKIIGEEDVFFPAVRIGYFKGVDDTVTPPLIQMRVTDTPIDTKRYDYWRADNGELYGTLEFK